MKENSSKQDWNRVKLSSRERRDELINMQKKLEQAEIA
jgi:cell division protein FtsN